MIASRHGICLQKEKKNTTFLRKFRCAHGILINHLIQETMMNPLYVYVRLSKPNQRNLASFYLVLNRVTSQYRSVASKIYNWNTMYSLYLVRGKSRSVSRGRIYTFPHRGTKLCCTGGPEKLHRGSQMHHREYLTLSVCSKMPMSPAL